MEDLKPTPPEGYYSYLEMAEALLLERDIKELKQQHLHWVEDTDTKRRATGSIVVWFCIGFFTALILVGVVFYSY